jgi:hypothetical protein
LRFWIALRVPTPASSGWLFLATEWSRTRRCSTGPNGPSRERPGAPNNPLMKHLTKAARDGIVLLRFSAIPILISAKAVWGQSPPDWWCDGLLSPAIVWVLRRQGQPLNVRIAGDPLGTAPPPPDPGVGTDRPQSTTLPSTVDIECVCRCSVVCT